MISGTALRLLNHLLRSERWARTRLATFGGESVRLESGRWAVSAGISSVGFFELLRSNDDTMPSVVIALPGDWALRAVSNQASVFSLARISGSADLAETLGFIFRNLHWDVESDLSLFFGDVLAHRLARSGKGLLVSHRELAKRFSLNLSEFLTEEDPVIARHSDLSKFGIAVTSVHDDYTRLEQRCRQLERN